MSKEFTGIWITKEIWQWTDLSLIEKHFFVEIFRLDNEDSCYASNKYFANYFGLSKGRCSQIIKNLVDKKYISIKLKYDGKQVDKRYISVVKILTTPIKNINHPYLENDKGGSKNTKGGYLENIQVNNTKSNNTKSNNTKSNNTKSNNTKSNNTKSNIKDIDHAVVDKSQGFDNWYSYYLRKKSKQQALKFWVRDKLYLKEQELIDKLILQNKTEYSNQEKQFIPHPSTYLNGKYYENEIEVQNNKSNNEPFKNNKYETKGMSCLN